MQSISPHALRLDFRSEERVVVVPDDEDRFVTTSKQAAQACRGIERFNEWREEFNGFLRHIRDWCARHERVRHSFLDVGSEGLTVLVVTKGDEFQFDFDDEITDLDVELARRFPRCPSDVFQCPDVPEVSRVPSLSLDAIHIYGHSYVNGRLERLDAILGQ